MVRVLHIGKCDSSFGGVEKIILDIYRNINKKKIQFDFLSPYKSTYELYRNEIEQNGGKIYELNNSRDSLKGKITYTFKLYNFFKRHNYKIIHINSGAFFFSLQVCIVAKICGIERIIVHSHSAPKIPLIKRLLKDILNPLYTKLATDYLSCSNDASKSLFSKRFIEQGNIQIIKNGINIDEYKFNKLTRDKVRKKYKIDNNIVYGHVGRLHEEKNHKFLLKVFYEIQKKQDNAILMIVGDGELLEDIKEQTKNLGIDNKVIFTGMIKDVNSILNAMDCFIFTSFYEGLAISVVEAQTCGLYTVCSTGIPIEAKISSNFKYIDLDKGPKEWSNQILNINLNSINREDGTNNARKNGYDINQVAKELEKIYERK